MVIKKNRHEFKLDDIEIAIDELEFGNYLELEGEKKNIDRLVKKLGFEKYPIETRSYGAILMGWER